MQWGFPLPSRILPQFPAETNRDPQDRNERNDMDDAKGTNDPNDLVEACFVSMIVGHFLASSVLK